MIETVARQPSGAPHIPVMLEEVLAALSPRDGEVYVDGTFGAGGYSRAILEAAECTLIALDRDENARPAAEDFAEIYKKRFHFVHTAFSDIRRALDDLGQDKIDGLVLDIGVSSMQIDQPHRGFSFQKDGPLDMRMDQSSGQSAAQLIAHEDEDVLADLIWKYGEERHSRRIAKAIIRERENTSIETTSHLADIIRGAIPGRPKPGHDKATRSFQALRISVNDELGELEAVLDAARDVLKPGGRLVVVTFHSLEDRIVKRFLAEYSGKGRSTSRYVPEPQEAQIIEFELPRGKAVKPSEDECARNPRARSAKLRSATRLLNESVSRGGHR